MDPIVSELSIHEGEKAGENLQKEQLLGKELEKLERDFCTPPGIAESVAHFENNVQALESNADKVHYQIGDNEHPALSFRLVTDGGEEVTHLLNKKIAEFFAEKPERGILYTRHEPSVVMGNITTHTIDLPQTIADLQQFLDVLKPSLGEAKVTLLVSSLSNNTMVVSKMGNGGHYVACPQALAEFTHLALASKGALKHDECNGKVCFVVPETLSKTLSALGKQDIPIVDSSNCEESFVVPAPKGKANTNFLVRPLKKLDPVARKEFKQKERCIDESTVQKAFDEVSINGYTKKALHEMILKKVFHNGHIDEEALRKLQEEGFIEEDFC